MADNEREMTFRIDSQDFDTQRVQVRRVAGREAISQPFQFDIDLITTDADGLDQDKVLGAAVSLVFARNGADVRTVHGMVSTFFDRFDSEPAHRTYRIRLVPRMHRLSFVEMQEVFLGLTVPDIIQQKLGLVNLSAGDIELRLFDKYPVQDIVVQYRETDLAFVSRLAEHLGISFFFDQQGDRDKLVFTDHNGGFARLDGFASLPYRRRGEQMDVFRLQAESHLFPANYAVLDYDYRAPHLELTSTYEHPAGYAGGVAEYGSHHRAPADGDRLARVRGEERAARSRFFRGESDLPELGAGIVAALQDHPQLQANLLIVEVEHRASQVVGLHGGSDEDGYQNSFKAVDASRAYRPPRVTPRPRIHGVLTAITDAAPAGASGRVAQIDDQGRYTVKFFFDAAIGEGRQRSSAPVRMAQPHAGNDYGVHFPLKPDVEVTVTFVDGDPDRPIISGAVPNPVTSSPVTQRDALKNRIKTRSGIKIELKDRS